MRKIMIMALIAVPVALLVFTGVAMAGVAPHGGYGTGTDFCLQCHDVHDAAGDYALTREATVTETCATCHGLYGNTPDGTWTSPPVDLVDGANATVSVYSAYKNIGAAQKSGHRLGVTLNGQTANNSDDIPHGTVGLRVMKSEDYGEGEKYNNEAASTFNGTQGLYCASCHTPHGSLTGQDTNGNGIADTQGTPATGNFGRELVVEDLGAHPHGVNPNRLLSSMPNHTETQVTSYNGFCMACHDEAGVQGMANDPMHNHPALCVSCHKKGAKGAADFPHTSGNQKLLGTDSDKNCTGCHGGVQPGGLNPLP